MIKHGVADDAPFYAFLAKSLFDMMQCINHTEIDSLYDDELVNVSVDLKSNDDIIHKFAFVDDDPFYVELIANCLKMILNINHARMVFHSNVCPNENLDVNYMKNFVCNRCLSKERLKRSLSSTLQIFFCLKNLLNKSINIRKFIHG